MSKEILDSERQFARFLTNGSIFSKLDFPLYVPTTRFNFLPLQLYCIKCQGERTHTYDMDKSDIKLVPGRKTVTTTYQLGGNQNDGPKTFNHIENGQSHKLVYNCQSCSVNSYYFLISFKGTKIIKSGQSPQMGIELDRRLEKTLGPDLVNHYKNGKICESHSLGIASMAYYRRVVEDKIYDLLDQVADLFSVKNKADYLQIVQKARESHNFEQKAELLKDVIPLELNGDDGNLVKFLFSKISEGLHSKTDEECLAISHDVSVLLEAIINIINTKADTSKSLKEISDRLKKS